ncbi:hypothetical protein BDV25DRAFT_141417 [Aspergillus avenaceus]|uniref:Uncharacterized protein n=1 Tax=Aspergillus avenaceus TaxID=36643 RepID=A0A5N6TRB5_ASPAV|nr:hypothetical protein BDV25DRAFT_141417 [Aspergillus avenaceus]
MDLHKVDPDIQLEVDLLILDYLLCITIDSLLYAGGEAGGEPSDECDLGWYTDTIGIFRSQLPATALLSDDVRIKLQLLELVNGFRQYPFDNRNLNPPSTFSHTNQGKSVTLMQMATSFKSLCKTVSTMVSETNWVDIAAQFVIQAVLEKHQAPGFTDTQNQRIAWAKETLEQLSGEGQVSAQYMRYVQPPIGPDHDRLTSSFSELPIDRFRWSVFDILRTIMKMLEPPVLIQLERGQLCGLSRAETQDLKNRVGLD